MNVKTEQFILQYTTNVVVVQQKDERNRGTSRTPYKKFSSDLHKSQEWPWNKVGGFKPTQKWFHTHTRGIATDCWRCGKLLAKLKEYMLDN